MPIVNLEEVESQGNVFIPKQVAIVRVIEAQPKLTKKDRFPMAVLTMEIVKPEFVDVNGERVGVAGLKFTHYVTYGGEGGLSMAKAFHKNLGLSMQLDPTSATDLGKFKGIAMEAELITEIRPSVDEAGNEVIDPGTGQVITRPNYKILGAPLRRNKEHSVAMPY